MKKIITLFLPSVFFVNLASSEEKFLKNEKQEIEASLYHIYSLYNPEKRPFLEVSFDKKKFFVESKINFDWVNTISFIFGKKIYINKTNWFIPKIGLLLPLENEIGYNGFNFETSFSVSLDRFEYFSINQYVLGLKHSPNIIYQYSEFKLPFERRDFSFSLNYSIQFLKLSSDKDLWIDQGPQFILSYKKVYFKPWYTWDPGHEKFAKLIIGIGYKM